MSALERLAGTGPPRDWPALVARLEDLARQAGADLIHAAERRGLTALRTRLLRDIE